MKSLKKNQCSLFERVNSLGKYRINSAVKRFSLKRSKFDKNVYYLQPAAPTKPKLLSRQPSAKFVKKPEQVTVRTACSTQHSARTNNRLPCFTLSYNQFNIDEYLQEMKRCVEFKLTKTETTDINTPQEDTMRKVSTVGTTSDTALRKKIRNNFPLEVLRESLLSVCPMYEPKEGTNPEQLYSLVEDERFSLLKIGTLSNDYAQLECTFKNGLVWSVNDKNELDVGFTLQELDRMLVRCTPQPIYTCISRYGLMEYEEINLAEPLVYSDCDAVQLALYLFVERFADSPSRTVDPTKKLWIRDSTGRLSFIELQGIICQHPSKELLQRVRSAALPFRKPTSQVFLHGYGSRYFRMPS